jgi:hypothetical protein
MGLTDDFTTNKYSLKCVTDSSYYNKKLPTQVNKKWNAVIEVRFLLKWKVYKDIQTIL